MIFGTSLFGFADLDIRWEYGSGLPYTQPFGFDDWIFFETLPDIQTEPGEYRVSFDRPYRGRLPDYHRLDVSVKRSFDIPNAALTLQAGLFNAYDRQNLFYFDVWTLKRVDQMSLAPGFRLQNRDTMIGGVARLVATVGLSLSVFALAGCETTLEPFAESDISFTILGYLDTDLDTQRVRISPLRAVVDRGGPEPIDALVTTTDLTSGHSVEWVEEAALLTDSSYGHIFWAPFAAEPGHTYQIVVERSDGARAIARTTVPERPSHADSVFGALNESGGFAPLYWPGVKRVIDVDVEYSVTRTSCDSPTFAPDRARSVFFRYTDDDLGSLEGSNWRIDLELLDHQRVIFSKLDINTPDQCVAIYGLWVRLATPSSDWEPPGGIWDQDVLIQPGTFSNVEGGLGWFGSVARTTVNWQLSMIALRDLLYYRYDGPRPADEGSL